MKPSPCSSWACYERTEVSLVVFGVTGFLAAVRFLAATRSCDRGLLGDQAGSSGRKPLSTSSRSTLSTRNGFLEMVIIQRSHRRSLYSYISSIAWAGLYRLAA